MLEEKLSPLNTELLVKNRDVTLPAINKKDFADMLEARIYDDIILWCNLGNGVFYITTQEGLSEGFYKPVNRSKYIHLADKLDRAGKKFMLAQTFETLGTATVVATNGEIENPLFRQYLQRYTCQNKYEADGVTVYYRMDDKEFAVAEYLNTRNNEVATEIQQFKDAGKPAEIPTVTLAEVAEKTGVPAEEVRLIFKRLEALEYRPYIALAVVS